MSSAARTWRGSDGELNTHIDLSAESSAASTSGGDNGSAGATRGGTPPATVCVCDHALADHNKVTQGPPCCDLCKCAGFRILLPEIGEVTIDPSYDLPGAVEYESDGTPFIILREYDERVLLHECIHAIFAREGEAREALTSDQEERIVRHLTRALYVAGWRLRVTDRSIVQVEHELNEVARQRDALAREIDGGGTRDYEYEARG